MENEILFRQLALDYCCTEAEVADSEHHFCEYRPLDGRRRYEETEDCFLKIAVVNGKLLFAGQREILVWCREKYATVLGEWFMDAKYLWELDDKLRKYGHRIRQIHPFFVPAGESDVGNGERACCLEKASDVLGITESSEENVANSPKNSEERIETANGEYDIVWYRGEEIEQFRGDSRFNEAYTFDKNAPDVIGVGAWKNGEICGMAGASADSPTMWQIGINVLPEARKQGIATMLVSLLKNQILAEGKLPYYGTAFSHIASQKVALHSGFSLSWMELVTERV